MGDAFRKLGYKPIFLVSSNMVLSQILDEMGSEILQQDLKDKGIEIYFGEDIVRVKTEREGLSTETQSGREFKGALLIIGKGTSPNINFLSSSGIEVDRGILVDELLKTNREEIFAAGDVCQGYDIVHRNKRVNALWPVAIEQGRNAAMNMTRFHIRYKGSVARNILTAFGNTLFTAGLSSSRDNGLEIYYRKKLRRYSRIVLRDGKLVGAIFLNVEINPGVYISAIERELDVHKLKDVLLSGSLSLAHLYPS
jgi:NAD(P)H-nitrite reductase large subunit